jgi:ribosomal protein S18 acetylase RimI-like enzyme
LLVHRANVLPRRSTFAHAFYIRVEEPTIRRRISARFYQKDGRQQAMHRSAAEQADKTRVDVELEREQTSSWNAKRRQTEVAPDEGLRYRSERRVPHLADLSLRPATLADVDAIVRISTGPIANKRAFVVESLAMRTVLTACVAERVVGYLIWDRRFFGCPFAWLVGVDPAFRRRGIATRLLREFALACPREALFTSTNESNTGMQTLLARSGFLPSGRVENIDLGDPEMFFFAPVRGPS